jgi:hypothetical protein
MPNSSWVTRYTCISAAQMRPARASAWSSLGALTRLTVSESAPVCSAGSCRHTDGYAQVARARSAFERPVVRRQ